jgi:hypothetical protein
MLSNENIEKLKTAETSRDFSCFFQYLYKLHLIFWQRSVAGRRRFEKKNRVDVPCALAEERPACLFPTAPAHLPSFFPYLLPQACVDVSNQMYIPGQ